MDPSMSIFEYLTQGNFFAAAGAIYLLPQLVKRMAKKVMSNQWVVRFMPFYPVVAAVLAIFLPGALQLPDRQAGTLAIAVVWLAWLASTAHKLIGQTLMGDDPRIKTLAVESPGQHEPVMEAN